MFAVPFAASPITGHSWISAGSTAYCMSVILAWSRVGKPEDVLTVGQEIEAKVLKVDAEKQRISLGLKQLQPHPWDSVPEKYKIGDRIRGPVTRIADFGAFVELDPGIEGLIHISEMSWNKKRTDSIGSGEAGRGRRGGDPWNQPDRAPNFTGAEAGAGRSVGRRRTKVPGGEAVEGTVTSLPKFGAFVQLAEGVEGLVHISEITAEKRLNHPQEVSEGWARR